MNKKSKIGVVCGLRKTFDYNTASQIFEEKKRYLRSINLVDWVIYEKPVFEVEDLSDVVNYFISSNIDAFIFISGTFHLGHLPLFIYKHLNKPVYFWGWDELPYDGGKIRLNSVCGVNLNCSNFYKSGIDNFHYSIGDEIDINWLKAINIIHGLNNSKVGIAGYRAHGFFNVDVDDTSIYKNFGILIDHFELSEIFNYNFDKEDFDYFNQKVKKIFNTKALSEEQINKVVILSAKLKKFFVDNNLSSLAIRCWPEFAASFSISPCASMSILQSEGIILTCEGDLDGSISMIAQKYAGSDYPYLADFSQINLKENFGLLWHCGVAPCNLWDGKCDITLDTYFAGGKGVTAGFVMKEGEISLLRLDSVNGDYRVFLSEGKIIPMDKALTGTYGKVVFKTHIKNVLDKIISNGIAHHISVSYGNYNDAFRIFAKIKKLKIIEGI
ncbi:MAG: fucose isomerase [Spirochaetes bacterium]|nr:fucose isomerase [Spirochaetota bacterium]